LLSGLARPPSGPLDAVIVTPLSTDEALYFARKSAARLTPDGHVWVVFLSESNQEAGERLSARDLGEMFAQQGFKPDGETEIGGAVTALAFRFDPGTTDPSNQT